MLTHAATTEKSTGTSVAAKKKTQPFFKPVMVQPKLTIGAVNDPHEREADAVADKVMRMADTGHIQPTITPVPIQRKCAHCEEEEKLQRKEGDGEDLQLLQRKPVAELPVQRKCAHCEEEGKVHRRESVAPVEISIQRKCDHCEANEKLHRKENATPSVPEITPSVHRSLHSNGHSLDPGTRSFMEGRFGYDFGNVQIHNDSLAHRSSADINALAYTHGRHIVFGAGQYQPATDSGKRLLAHELTHVVQQNASNYLREGRINRDEDKEKKPLTRYQEIEQSIDTPGEFEVLQNPFGFSFYNFAINRFNLKPEHKKALQQVGELLKSDKKHYLTIKIVGNTDSTGGPEINDPLSVRRGRSVRAYLSGITGRKYDVEGDGENMPFTSNETDTGRTRNRRADIVVSVPGPPEKHDPKPPNPDMPPAYSHFEKPEIFRHDFDITGHKCEGWLCDIDLPCPPFCLPCPPFCWPIPECAKLAIECFEEDLEACYELYEKCWDSKDDEGKPKRHACPVGVNLPAGELPVHAEWPLMGLPDPFWMILAFENAPENDRENGCSCECGEYEQLVRGYFEYEYEDGRIERDNHIMHPGEALEEHTFHEDGTGGANSGYGHRSHPQHWYVDHEGDVAGADAFLPDQQTGCTYIGADRPGFANPHINEAKGEVRRKWFLEFQGRPVDTCVIPGVRVPLLPYNHTWQVQGEIRRPPQGPPQQHKPPGNSGQPGGNTKPTVVTPKTAKSHPTSHYTDVWYAGGIPHDAKTGQTFDMVIGFHVPGKSDVFLDIQKVVVIEPTDDDTVTIETLNDKDLNLAPDHEPELVLGAHKKQTIRRTLLDQ